jgi:hypothetical protein
MLAGRTFNCRDIDKHLIKDKYTPLGITEPKQNRLKPSVVGCCLGCIFGAAASYTALVLLLPESRMTEIGGFYNLLGGTIYGSICIGVWSSYFNYTNGEKIDEDIFIDRIKRETKREREKEISISLLSMRFN